MVKLLFHTIITLVYSKSEPTKKKNLFTIKKFLITQLSNNDQILLNKIGLGISKFSSKKDWNSVILNGDAASIR